MFKRQIFKNIPSSINKNSHRDKINKIYIYYSKIKTQYNNIRNLLQKDKFNSTSEKNGMSEYQKHIRLIIITAIIITFFAVLISSYFLILYIRKRCKKKNKEVKAKNKKNKNISKSKKSIKDIMSNEIDNINHSEKNFLRRSLPVKKNQVRNSKLINFNFNNDDKITNSNEEQSNKKTPKKNNEFLEFTFRPSSNIKDNCFQVIIGEFSF